MPLSENVPKVIKNHKSDSSAILPIFAFEKVRNLTDMGMQNMSSICLMKAAVILSAMFCLTSCNDVGNSDTQVRQDSTAIAGRRAGGEPCHREFDWDAYYQSILREYGVDDFTTASLIAQMDSNKRAVRTSAASLLGHRKEVSAIPRLEAALYDESLNTQMAATEALLKMGNRSGIKVMEAFCAKASNEFDRGDYRNTIKYSDMAQVLADAGEVFAIAHLRRLIKYDRSWGVRLVSLRSLERLHEKDPSVWADIAAMKNDENPQIRKEAANIFKRLEEK